MELFFALEVVMTHVIEGKGSLCCNGSNFPHHHQLFRWCCSSFCNSWCQRKPSSEVFRDLKPSSSGQHGNRRDAPRLWRDHFYRMLGFTSECCWWELESCVALLPLTDLPTLLQKSIKSSIRAMFLMGDCTSLRFRCVWGHLLSCREERTLTIIKYIALCAMGRLIFIRGFAGTQNFCGIL